MKIAEFCAKLDALLTTRATQPEKLDAIVSALRQALKLQPDEVALLTVDVAAETLVFLWPAKLAKSGFIPLSSHDSLAARTLRENKVFVNNRFSATFHASVFEQVKLDPAAEGRPLPIQKIISVPIPGETAPKGVLQLSRKATEPGQAGDDFSKEDMAALTEVAQIIAKHI
ncbi:MAG TPA: hypothetical protein DEB35_06765 [Desulfuromonas sp.]|nr:hypothetical protein [Desulfuromonas sp.]